MPGVIFIDKIFCIAAVADYLLIVTILILRIFGSVFLMIKIGLRLINHDSCKNDTNRNFYTGRVMMPRFSSAPAPCK